MFRMVANLSWEYIHLLGKNYTLQNHDFTILAFTNAKHQTAKGRKKKDSMDKDEGPDEQFEYPL